MIYPPFALTTSGRCLVGKRVKSVEAIADLACRLVNPDTPECSPKVAATIPCLCNLKHPAGGVTL